MKRRAGIFAFFITVFVAAGIALSGVAFAFTCALGNLCFYGSENFLSKRLPEISVANVPIGNCVWIPSTDSSIQHPAHSVYNNSSKDVYLLDSNCNAIYAVPPHDGLSWLGLTVLKWKRLS